METPGALQDLVWLHLATGDTESAERSVRRLLSITPDEAEPHRGLAGIMRMTNRPIEAEQAYRRALELDRSHEAARGELAGLLLSQQRRDDAIVVLQEGESVSPDPPRWRVQSGTMLAPHAIDLLQHGQTDAGIAMLRKALQLNPSMTQMRYNLAVALLSIPQVADAIGHLERVVQEKPQMAEAHYNLAVAVYMSGRPADAIPHAREALRLAPNDEQAKRFLAMLLEQN